MPGHRITIDFETDPIGLDSGALQSLVEQVLDAEDVEDNSGMGILFTHDDRMREFNVRFRNIDAPTDVLSFGFEDGGDFADDAANELGDVIVSLDTAARQAIEHVWGLQEEVSHLVVHATLHLCGYDHEESEEGERTMLAREEHYLGPLGNVHPN